MTAIEAKVDYEIRETVAWITLNRPQKLNALADDMREQFLAPTSSLRDRMTLFVR